MRLKRTIVIAAVATAVAAGTGTAAVADTLTTEPAQQQPATAVPVKPFQGRIIASGVHLRAAPASGTIVGLTRELDTMYISYRSPGGQWLRGTDLRTDQTGWVPNRFIRR